MKVAVITDDIVKKLYGKPFLERGYTLFSFPPGEASKTRATKEKIEDALVENGFFSDTVIIGLGGGVVTDIAGFTAATFCRGVPLILIPTTLVAMVDAAIGGKNGVNTALGKNLVGSVYDPAAVILRTEFLKTLPEKEMENGRTEMLKVFLLSAPEMIREPDLEVAIEAAIEIKRRIVASDPYGQAQRRLLNFGHTVGHALETLSGYALSHGEAVAAGIVIESRIALEMGILKADAFDQIAALFPEPKIEFSPEKIVEAMQRDKKGVRFVMLQELGIPATFEGAYCSSAPMEILTEVLHAYGVCARLQI